MKSFSFLKAAGYSSLFFGLFHVPFIFLGEEAARFFSAPPFVRAMIRDNSPWIYLVVAILLLVFGVFGAYPLSADGVLRRKLPCLKAGLRVIACIYTLRGLVLIPQILLLVRMPHMTAPQTLVFSAVSLLVAGFYWLGLRELSTKA